MSLTPDHKAKIAASVAAYYADPARREQARQKAKAANQSKAEVVVERDALRSEVERLRAEVARLRGER